MIEEKQETPKIKWFQMWVRHEGNTIEVMKHCDPVLQHLGSIPATSHGVPVQEEDGTIEVRSYNEMGFRMAKNYLKEQGFIIVREQRND